MIESLVRIIEDTVFEILSLIFYIPFTAIRVLKPGWVHRYSVRAYEKPEEEKPYKGDISPILFYFASLVAALVLATVDFSFSSDIVRNITEANLILAALSAFSVPFLYALVIWLAKSLGLKKLAEKDELRRLFDVQSLLWGDFLLLFIAIGRLIFNFTRSSVNEPFFPQFNNIHTWVLVIYFLYLQIAALLPEMPQLKRQGVVILISFSVLWYALFLYGLPRIPIWQPMQFLMGIG
jgi:hypothetical protein